MNKNVLNWIMLLGLFAFLLPACSTSRSPSSRSSTPKTPSVSKVGKLRQDMVRYAYRYKGAKYKYGGNGPGFDCSGLTYKVYQQFNFSIPRTSSSQAALGKKIPVQQARPGDLAFFSKGSSGGKINHVALIVDNNSQGLRVIHSTSSRGVIVEYVNQSPYWKARLRYVRNVIGN